MVTAGPAFPGPIFLESNRVGRRICGTARNASHALKRAGDGRNMQELDRAFLLAALDGLNTNIYITDTVTNRIVYANENMKRIFGLEEPEGRICWEVLQDGMDGICPFCRIRRLQAMGGEQSCVWDEMNTLTGRTYKNFDCLIRWEGRDYYVQNSIDVTEYRKLTEEAGLDELTQMMNRRAGKVMMETALKAAREAKRQMAVVLLDINELKRINDLYGHSEGDRLLQYVSAVLQPRLRTGDLMFRLSGDEFVLILSGEDKNSAAQRIAQAQKAIADQREQNGIFYEASFSFGVAEAYPEDRCTVDELISQADRLMYLNKRDYHIRRARARLQENGSRSGAPGQFEYDKDHLFDALSAGTDDYLFIGNLKNGCFRYSPHMVEEFGLPGEVVENAAAFWGNIIHPDDEQYFLESNQEIADGREEYHNIEYRARNVRGSWIWLRCRGRMTRDENDEPEMFAGMITNLGKHSQIDHMTGLYNRFEFEGNIKKYMMDERVEGLGIMILDMDAFKNINDLYDRSFGDEVLRLTGRKIAAVLPENAGIYRLDGDEFGIIVLGGDEEQCSDLYNRIQYQFARQQEYGGRKFFCTVSAGLAFYPKDGDNYLELLKYANYSLEHSKVLGKNRSTVFSRSILWEKERRLKMAELLRESIDRGFAGFSVCYQPQVRAISGRLYGAEALARWHCSEFGDVSPVEFIPILEQTGLIGRLGEWVFRSAARQCSLWRRFDPDFTVSVNLSYVELMERDIFPVVMGALEEFGLPPANVTLELTESCMVKEDKQVNKIMGRFREAGLKVAMDDFGTGYSSLYSLKNIPADVVKIDRSFVTGITEVGFNATLIRSVAQLCGQVDMRVCVEGVETEAEHSAVKGMGVELIQGYYFGRPMLPELFEQKFMGT